jgi:hydroxymethylbilane synthase
MSTKTLRLGTRSSALAQWQAHWVAAQLEAHGRAVSLVPITTRGDVQTGQAIGQLGGSGLFTKELQRALLDERIDLAVHSLKDLPTEPVAGLSLAAVPPRENPRDVLVCRDGATFEQLAAGATIGTGSLRRRAQLLHARGDLAMRDIRGNVDTRLEKLAAGQFDALVLAYAGLKRLGREAAITEVLEPPVMLPAVGQGALGIETRSEDHVTQQALAPLDHGPTHAACLAERALLLALGGGCLAPIAAWAQPAPDGGLRLEAAVLSADGATRLAASGTAPAEENVALAREVAERLIAAGALDLIRQSRSSD